MSAGQEALFRDFLTVARVAAFWLIPYAFKRDYEGA